MSTRITIDEAIEKLHMGGVVALPTETVYGLAAMATLPAAIDRVYIIKNRPGDNPLICHFDSIEMVEQYTTPLEPYVQWLMQELTPGPVSFLLPLNTTKGSLLNAATRGSHNVVCRIPEHWLTLSVVKQLGVPLAAPSANTSGHVSPTNAQMVLEDIGNLIDGIVDGGPCLVGIESTILDCTSSGHIRILRPGAIGFDLLQSILLPEFNHIKIMQVQALLETTPGTKYRHYAPHTNVKPITKEEAKTIFFNSTDVVIGCEEDIAECASNVQTINLGPQKDAEYIARNLYQNLVGIDTLKPLTAYYIIHRWGTTDLEMAIANRIDKAFGLFT